MEGTNPFLAPKAKTLILGHRGVPHVHQENTVAGFRRAVELGLDGVEMDVFVTGDDRVVVFHDEDTERLTGVKGDITSMSWDEVSKLRLRRRVDMGKNAAGENVTVTYETEEPIPLLEDVLAEFGGTLAMNVELKPPNPSWSERHTGTRVAEVIRSSGYADSVVVTSFDFFKLHALEKEFPGLHSGFAYDDNFLDFCGKWLKMMPELPSEIAQAEGNQNPVTILNRLVESNRIGRWIDSSVAAIEHTLVDSDTVATLRDQQMAVGVFTLFPLDTTFVKKPLPEAEEIALANRLFNLGVDWMECDDPAKLMEIREAR